MLNINEQIKIATELENEYKNSHELGIPLDKEQISPQNKPRIVNLFMPWGGKMHHEWQKKAPFRV